MNPDLLAVQKHVVAEVTERLPVHEPPIPMDLTSPHHPIQAFISLCREGFLLQGDAKFVFRAVKVLPSRYEEDVKPVPAGYREKGAISISVEDLIGPPGGSTSGLATTNLAGYIARHVAEGNDVVVTNGVVLDGESWRIPMIDFCTEEIDDLIGKEVVESMKKLDLDLSGFQFFESGQSYHGYGPKPMTEREHSMFLGKLLLLPDGLVDTRWVGHCLAREFASLRWTCTSAHYRRVPRLIKSPYAK